MSIVQYIANLVGGACMFFVIGAYMTVASGFGILGAVLFFAPILLFGFVSGLSLFFPRASAVSTLFLGLPFLYVGARAIAGSDPASEPFFFLLPAALVTSVAVTALFLRRRSIWSWVERPWAKALVLVAAFTPAVYTTYVLVEFFSNVSFGNRA